MLHFDETALAACSVMHAFAIYRIYLSYDYMVLSPITFKGNVTLDALQGVIPLVDTFHMNIGNCWRLLLCWQADLALMLAGRFREIAGMS
jgi:hypothetical protein